MKEITEQLEGIEEVLEQLVKGVKALESKQPDLSQLQIPDHSFSLRYLAEQLGEAQGQLKSVKQLESDLITTMNKVNEKLNEEPKPQVKNFRLFLFPPDHALEYYKVVFGRLLPWTLAFFVLCYIVKLADNSIDAWKQHDYNKQNEQMAQAWIYLYDHSNKQVKKEMNNALEKSQNQ